MTNKAYYFAAIAAVSGIAAACAVSTPAASAPPRVAGQPLPAAYAVLHRAGFVVTVRGRFEISTFCVPKIATESTIGRTAALGVRVCVPKTATVKLHEARVPNFAGRTLAQVAFWSARTGISWDAPSLPGLHAGNRATLLGSYRVTRQSPAAGTLQRSGVPGPSSGLRPTPVHIWAVARS